MSDGTPTQEPQSTSTTEPTVTPTPTSTPEVAPVITAPETFTPLTADAFQLPEGFTPDPAELDGFLSIMNNRELTPQQQAQSLINLQASLATKSSEMGSQAWDQQQQDWQAAVAADPVIGGANLDKTMLAVGRVMDQYGTPEVRAAFDQTGAGNHPEVVRFLATLGAQLAEATVPPGGSPHGSSTTSMANRLYGS